MQKRTILIPLFAIAATILLFVGCNVDNNNRDKFRKEIYGKIHKKCGLSNPNKLECLHLKEKALKALLAGYESDQKLYKEMACTSTNTSYDCTVLQLHISVLEEYLLEVEKTLKENENAISRAENAL